MFRGSHRSCSVKKRCSKKFCKIHRKIPAPESLNKVAGLRHTCFPINFAKFLRPLFFTEHVWETASQFCYFRAFKNFHLFI